MSEQKVATQEKHIRFVFKTELCFGCPSCVTACREKNSLPQGIDRRRLGEMEDPQETEEVPAIFLSMACNHCLDPACEKGCPVGAYSITPEGIVLHNQDACMGCGYCTDTCPYGVPLLRPDTGVVTKCDFCIDLLKEGEKPACVDACPSGAIEVSRKPIEFIEKNYEQEGAGPELPPPGLTRPSTKFSRAKSSPWLRLKRVFRRATRTEPPETALTAFTILFHGAGIAGIIALATTILPDRVVPPGLWKSIAGLMVLGFVMGSFHPGRPDRGYRFFLQLFRSAFSLEIASVLVSILSIYSLTFVEGNLRYGMGVLFSVSVLTGFITAIRIHQTYTRPVREFFALHFQVGAIAAGFLVFIALSIFFVKHTSLLEIGLAGVFVMISFLYGKRKRTDLPQSRVKELKTATLLLKEVASEEQVSLVFLLFSLSSLFSMVFLQLVVAPLGFAAAISGLAHIFMERRIYYRLSVPRTVPGARMIPERKIRWKNPLRGRKLYAIRTTSR